MMDLNLVSAGIRAVAMLFVVLALLVGVLYFLKRFSLRNRLAPGEVGIKVLSSLSLSARDRIQVVEILGEKIVLGISPGGITCITKLGDNDEDVTEGRRTQHETD